jgi:hypothetical protein
MLTALNMQGTGVATPTIVVFYIFFFFCPPAPRPWFRVFHKRSRKHTIRHKNPTSPPPQKRNRKSGEERNKERKIKGGGRGKSKGGKEGGGWKDLTVL